jgi:PTS system N-acetylglucosamine-specific IIC component
MLPIATLPAAGLLLRLGQDDLLGKINWPDSFNVAAIVGQAGSAIIDNLPILFAVGVAVGFARKSEGATGLAGVVGFLVAQNVYRVFTDYSANYGPGKTAAKDALPMAVASNPGVILGIVVGITAAMLFDKFYRFKPPQWLAFFGGRRFVPIITAAAATGWGIVFGLLWPPIAIALEDLGTWMGNNPEIGGGAFGMINRLLLPIGLHHILNTFLWFQLGTYTNPETGAVATGDISRYLAGDPTAGIFQAGFFPIFMFALPAAGFAMYRAAKSSHRAGVASLMLSAGITAFVTGITEPLEFSFMFVAPVLYGLHAVMTGASLFITNLLDVRIGFSFSAGFIDYALNFTKSNSNRPYLIPVIGAAFAAIYYTLFTVLIKAMDLKTPGRESDEEAMEEGLMDAPAS